MKVFDNVVVKIFFLFLPFSYALTLNVGFPLKISEIALFVILTIIAFSHSRLRIHFVQDSTVKFFLIFLLLTFVLMLTNLFWIYPYPLDSYTNRFGYRFDSILKFFYVVLAFLTFGLSANVFTVNPQRYINLLLLGGIIAGCYSWYLFISGLLHFTPLLLPGIEKPQYISLAIGNFIRSGTFLEGNFMGLFIMICIILSLYSKRIFLAYFFILTLFTTFSSIGFLSTGFFLICYYFKNNYTPKRLLKLTGIFVLFALFILVLMGNEDFNYLVLSKISIDKNSISNNGEYSKVDRMNLSLVGIRMGLDNPVFGVGISNYARHYGHFNEDLRFPSSELKRIPNNVYVELLAEMGFIGLALFAFFLYLIYKKTRHDKSYILRYGFIGVLIYFFAFPTFSVLYIWVFFGLIASLRENSLSTKTPNLISVTI